MKGFLYLILVVSLTLAGCTPRNSKREAIIIDPVESMPSFPGGTDSLNAYLKKNNQWKVGQLTIEGRVVVGFIVSEKGKLEEIKILKSLCSSCDKEAIRLVENMPAWIPAEENGKPTARRMILPISFNGLK
jgi:protein TonB